MKFEIVIETDETDSETKARLVLMSKEIHRITAEHGDQSCSVIGQVYPWKFGMARVKARVFTGEALEYLSEHMKVATDMQDASESEEHSQ